MRNPISKWLADHLRMRPVNDPSDDQPHETIEFDGAAADQHLRTGRIPGRREVMEHPFGEHVVNPDYCWHPDQRDPEAVRPVRPRRIEHDFRSVSLSSDQRDLLSSLVQRELVSASIERLNVLRHKQGLRHVRGLTTAAADDRLTELEQFIARLRTVKRLIDLAR